MQRTNQVLSGWIALGHTQELAAEDLEQLEADIATLQQEFDDSQNNFETLQAEAEAFADVYYDL